MRTSQSLLKHLVLIIIMLILTVIFIFIVQYLGSAAEPTLVMKDPDRKGAIITATLGGEDGIVMHSDRTGGDEEGSEENRRYTREEEEECEEYGEGSRGNRRPMVSPPGTVY